MSRVSLAELEAVYRSGYTRFVRVASAITRDEQAARDAVHDGFVRAVRHRDRWDGRGPLAGWIWRIVVNAAVRTAAERPLPADIVAVETTNGHEPDDGVRALVAALPERQRLVLFLRYYADLDYEAIAAALDIRPGTVAATLNAAHAALRRQLQEVPR
ncbi:MAG: RNA polymerase sigma factor [Gaiellaceae bacterium]